MVNVNQLVSSLSDGVVTIRVEKVNGEVREMTCTLQPQAIADAMGVAVEDVNMNSPQLLQEDAGNNITVFDLEKNGWRTIRPDHVSFV